MPKISQLPNDATPVATDYVSGVQTSGTTTKSFLLSKLITLFFNNIPAGSLTASTNGLTKSAADANGWVKKDYGAWQQYEQSFSFSTTLTSNQQTNIASFTIPVGVASSTALRFVLGYQGGYSGIVNAGIDGNSSSFTTNSIYLYNTSTNSHTITGYVHIVAVTI